MTSVLTFNNQKGGLFEVYSKQNEVSFIRLDSCFPD